MRHGYCKRFAGFVGQQKADVGCADSIETAFDVTLATPWREEERRRRCGGKTGKQATGRNTSLAWRGGATNFSATALRNASHERAGETAFCSTLDGNRPCRDRQAECPDGRSRCQDVWAVPVSLAGPIQAERWLFYALGSTLADQRFRACFAVVCLVRLRQDDCSACNAR